MKTLIKEQIKIAEDAFSKSKESVKEHFNLLITEVKEKQTKSDMLYEASANMNKEEFRKAMNEEYEKVVKDPNYFFKNYFKTKWNESTTA